MKEFTDKRDFIAALRRFAEVGGEDLYDCIYKRTGYREHRGERLLAMAIAKYLDDPKIPGDTPGINWYRDLQEHLVDAFVEFRTHKKWDALREAYKIKQDGRNEIPDLVDLHIGGLHRLLVTHEIAYLSAVLSGQEWLMSSLEAHFDAQRFCVDQAWERFVRIGYRELMPRIKKESHRGNRGEFGSTTLMTYCMAGRCMFTFLRGKDGGPTMTYVADDSDMWGVRSGSNATATPFMECISMINEVSDNWDIKKMKKDTEIGMGL